MGEAKKHNNFSLVMNYMNDEKKRQSLNKLAQSTFKISFEEWYQNGYCSNQYLPYALWDNDHLIANVSANIMNFKLFGMNKNYIQIGTVMTDTAYRKQGCGKYLIEKVMEDYLNHSDGLYLFANDKAKGFYEKLGFVEAKQYEFVKYYNRKQAKDGQIPETNMAYANDFVKVDKAQPDLKIKYLNYLKQAEDNSSFVMDNYGLMTFWTAGMDDIYYSERLDCFISAQIEDQVLFLNSITSTEQITISEIMNHLGAGIQKIVPRFVPAMDEIEDFETEEHVVKNDTLYIMGKEIEKDLLEYKLMFPVYSHA